MKSSRAIACLACVVASLILLGLRAQGDNRNPTMISLLANPKQYDGKPVQVIGYVHLEFEGNGFYLHREDFENETGNVVWLEVNPNLGKKYNDKYVIVDGTFDAEDNGHMGMFQGAITKVTRFDIWSDPKHTARRVYEEQVEKEVKAHQRGH